jgi:CheY-like chemotaxis protein
MLPQDEHRAPAAPARLRVLVVEDDADTAEATALLLRLYGHEVRVAADGPAALALAAAEPPEVVLLDIGLPGMDGCEVARRLRHQATPRPPVLIALTGYGWTEVWGRCYEAGVDLYLLKPADPDALRTLLDGKAVRRDSACPGHAAAAPPAGSGSATSTEPLGKAAAAGPA